MLVRTKLGEPLASAMVLMGTVSMIDFPFFFFSFCFGATSSMAVRQQSTHAGHSKKLRILD